MDFCGGGALEPGESGPELSATPTLAPELLEGFPASPVTDTYSVGCAALLSPVRLPASCRIPSLADVRRAHIEGKRIHLRDLRPDLPDTVVEIVERAAHPDSGSRYSTAGDLEHALAGVLGAAPPIRLPAGPAVDDRRAAWSWREAGWAIVFLTLVVWGLLGVLLFRPPVPATNPRMVRLTLGAPYNTASWPRLLSGRPAAGIRNGCRCGAGALAQTARYRCGTAAHWERSRSRVRSGRRTPGSLASRTCRQAHESLGYDPEHVRIVETRIQRA